MSASKFECQKFSPNIFNKSKCQHCFRSKDLHSSEALENNRASRKISKCGYLFVAPDWDFTIEMNRTKRWQRRWFVLYEDGELTYSVDEHPDTIPQAIIDMTEVIDVSDAEDITGNKFSITIRSPEKSYFIKGTCKEESKWWYDVLVVYPRTVKGRPKRNATFPCIKSSGTSTTTTIVQSDMKGVGGVAGRDMKISPSRLRFHSCRSDFGGVEDEPLRDSTSSALNTCQPCDRLSISDVKANGKLDDLIKRDVVDVLYGDENIRQSRIDVHRLKSCQKRDTKRHFHSQRSRSLGCTTSGRCDDDIDGPTSPTNVVLTSPPPPRVPSPLYIRLSDVPKMKRYDSLESLQMDESGPLSPKSGDHCHKAAKNDDDDDESEFDSWVGRSRRRRQQQLKSNRELVASQESHYSSSPSSSSSNRNDGDSKPSLTTLVVTNPVVTCNVAVRADPLLGVGGGGVPHFSVVSPLRSGNEISDEPWREHQIRGDPDGCGLDHMVRCPSTMPEIRTADPLNFHRGEEYINIKKGWLMKLEHNEDWHKRWCVLMGSTFKVFSDSNQEDVGKPCCVVQMQQVQHVEEVDVARNYGLKIKMIDGKCYTFSAVTATFRSNWIYALKNSANATVTDVTGHDLPLLLKGNQSERLQRSTTSSPHSSVFSSDEELRTVLGAQTKVVNGSGSNSSYSSMNVANGSSQPSVSTSTARTLPPSPPLNRTVISKVKERARLKTNVRVSSRSSRMNKSAVVVAAAAANDSKHADEVGKSNLQCAVDEESHQCVVSRSSVASQEFVRSPSKSNILRQKDKSRRFSLPGKSSSTDASTSSVTSSLLTTSSRLVDSDQSSTSVPGKASCLSRSSGKEKKVVEVQKSRLQTSEDKLQTLRSDVDVRLEKKQDQLLGKESNQSCDDGGGGAPCLIDVEIVEDKSEESHQEEEEEEEDTTTLREALDLANSDLSNLVSKLQSTAEENETLRRLLSLDGADVVTRVNCVDAKKLSRVNSLSDLTNIGEGTDMDGSTREVILEKYRELRARFEKAVNEIKTLRRELKESYGRFDEMEVASMNQKQCAEAANADYKSQLRLMSERIEDLTSKLTNSEKQLRQHVKAKNGKPESKEQRRTRSLKGREMLTVSKEVENKVEDLEKKLVEVEGLLKARENVEKHSAVESGSDVASGGGDSKAAHVFVRLNSLDSKVSSAIHKAHKLSNVNSSLTRESANLSKAVSCPSVEQRLSSEKADGFVVSMELNRQIEELRAHTTELELALSGFRCKMDICRILLEEVTSGKDECSRRESLQRLQGHLADAAKWLDGTTETNLEVERCSEIFTRVSRKMNELLDSRVNVASETALSEDTSGVTEHRRKLLISKLSREASVIDILSRCIPSTTCESVTRAKLLTECAKELLCMMETFSSKVEHAKSLDNNSSVGSWEVFDCQEIHSTSMDRSDVADLIKELEDCENTLTGSFRLWRDEWIESFVTHMLTTEGNVVDYVGDVGSHPAMVEMKDCLNRAQLTLVQKMAESDVVTVVLNLFRSAGLSSESTVEVTTWLQNLIDERTELTLDTIRQDVVELVRDIQLAFDEAVMVEDGEAISRHSSCKVLGQTFADSVVQAALLVACSTLLRSSLKNELDGNSDTVEVVDNSISPSPTLPRIIGEVVKADFKSIASLPTAVKSRKPEAASASAVDDEQCQQCKELQRKVKQMAEKYANDLLLETERHQANLEALYQQHAENLFKAENDHQEREQKYVAELKSLQEKLNSLEEDYELQLVSLKELFEQQLARRTDIQINKENVQRKYRAEFEQLKNLCEKGLVAMELSHRRIVAELEEKHRRELEELQVEKDQALAEETQATLAALDAMRKAHEAELQKEVARFKDELLQKIGHSSADLAVLHREHKEEMEIIKQEILTLSEKYSVKCLECAALEEHVEIVTNQLSEANSLIFDLTARNKQLNSHLKQNMRELRSLTRDEQSSLRNEETMKELRIHLKLKESQLIEKDEEIAELNRKLTATKNQHNKLENHCRILDANMKAGNKTCGEELETLRARLESIIMRSSCTNSQDELRYFIKPSDNDQTFSDYSESKTKKIVGGGNNTRGRDLMRSPSCPGLSPNDDEESSTKHLKQYKTGSPSAPLVGVVASRKRIFEYPDTKRT